MDKVEACRACQVDAVAVDEVSLHAWLAVHAGWQYVHHSDCQKLVKYFSFSNFAQAFEATAKLATLAEQYQHHPELRLSWGQLEVHWWSHKIRAVHALDLLLAEMTDTLLAGAEVQA